VTEDDGSTLSLSYLPSYSLHEVGFSFPCVPMLTHILIIKYLLGETEIRRMRVRETEREMHRDRDNR
jgi:hypothetical protein